MTGFFISFPLHGSIVRQAHYRLVQYSIRTTFTGECHAFCMVYRTITMTGFFDINYFRFFLLDFQVDLAVVANSAHILFE